MPPGMHVGASQGGRPHGKASIQAEVKHIHTENSAHIQTGACLVALVT